MFVRSPNRGNAIVAKARRVSRVAVRLVKCNALLAARESNPAWRVAVIQISDAFRQIWLPPRFLAKEVCNAAGPLFDARNVMTILPQAAALTAQAVTSASGKSSPRCARSFTSEGLRSRAWRIPCGHVTDGRLWIGADNSYSSGRWLRLYDRQMMSRRVTSLFGPRR
jgi:hypothetical protein